MKKLLSVLIALIMIFTAMAVPASAISNKHVKCPIIFIAGSSVDLVDAEGNEVTSGFDVLTEGDDSDEDSITKDDIIESTMNILIPFITEGLPMDKWDNYGKALEEELSPIWDETQLDENGNTKYGVGVSKDEIDYWDNIAATKNTGADGSFNLNDYKFRYDWRLSPYDSVDRLHEFIKTVIKTTKCPQVALVGRCLGGNIITAYLEKYGGEGLVKKVFFDEVMVNGAATVSDCFSGKIKFSAKHAQAYIQQSAYYGEKDIGVDLTSLNDIIIEIVERTMDLLTQTGAADSILFNVELLYQRLYTALMPSLLRATGFGTWVSYWTTVYEEDMDAALDLVFGKEGTESREKYAGLISKIEYVREHITSKRPNLFKDLAEAYNVEVGVLAAYGLANAPIVEHYDETGDTVVGVSDASFGATAAGLFDALPQSYIDQRVKDGYGDFISADGKIDASTCLFPETTWFVKNKHHDVATGWYYLAERFTQYENYTVTNNYGDISRFLVSVKDNDTKGFENMNEENMADGAWLSVVEQKPVLETKLASLMRFLTTLLRILTMLLNGVEIF